jgi:hypothetical protein
MDTLWKASIWQQFGAAIDMLENNVRACPDELWTASLWTPDPEQPVWAQVWYIVYHTLFWLDLYLSGAVEGFMPPTPYTLDELDPAGLVPDRVYSKDELLSYLEHCRTKCRTTMESMTDERAHQITRWGTREMPFVELYLYNMRHVQEHGAQLSMLLGQNTQYAPRWVAKATTK